MKYVPLIFPEYYSEMNENLLFSHMEKYSNFVVCLKFLLLLNKMTSRVLPPNVMMLDRYFQQLAASIPIRTYR
jgi:hypothetical protein